MGMEMKTEMEKVVMDLRELSCYRIHYETILGLIFLSIFLPVYPFEA
jgi:hypothetical protein